MTARIMLRNFLSCAISSAPGLLAGRGWECLLPTLRFFLTRKLKPFTTRHGYLIENRQQLLCWWGTHIQGHLFRHMDMEIGREIILDIGANYGSFGFECRRRYPNAIIVAFEPSVNLLEKCISLKHNDSMVYNLAFPYALADREGEAELFCHSVEGSWTATLEPGAYQPTYVTACYAKRLDDFKLAPLVVKIDVDGGELLVLRGGYETLAHAKHIICEIEKPERVNRMEWLLNRKAIHLGACDYLFKK